jgi:ABC-type transport system involved in multi-copper enzyme maturation permease subunit
MLGAIIGFELRRRLKMLSSYVYAVVLFTSGFFLMAASAGLFKSLSASSGSERVHANSPHSVFANLNVMALLGLFTVAAIFGQAASQDFNTGTWPLIFTRNVKKATYLVGRFLGAYVFSAGLFLSIGAGLITAAVLTGFIDHSHLGDHRLEVYLWPYLISVWPMLFVTGALFFSLAALSRQMAPVYVGVVVLVLGYLVISSAIGDVQNRTLGSLLDPFGFIAFDVATRYWTPAERNRDLMPLTGLFLANRVLWLGVGAALLGLTINRFRTTVDEQKGRGPIDDEQGAVGPLPTTRPDATTSGWLRTAVATGWLHFRDVVRSPVYWSFVAAGLLFVLIGLVVAKEIFGTPTYPVTWRVLELAGGTFAGFTIITLTFYAGELVWKERDAQLADIIDASRVPTWVPFFSKLLALVLITASLQLVIGAASLLAQLSRGFVDIEWRLYLSELVLFGVLQDVLIAVLALVVQIFVNQKYLGHGVMVLYYVSQTVLGLLGVEDRLARFGSEPRIEYSDMNGYGHWIPAALAYRAYWWSLATVLLIVAFLFAARGRASRRGEVALARFTTGWRVTIAAALVSAIAVGGWLYTETHVHHRYSTSKDDERDSARYEKEWKAWASKPLPRIVDADMQLDLFPDESPPRLEAKGTYLLENKTSEPITDVLVHLGTDAKVERLAIGEVTTPSQVDEALQLKVFTLSPPLQPGERRPLTFALRFTSDPIVHRGRRTDVVGNGTFFNNFNFPMLGYQEANELSDDGDRKDYGLPPKERMLDRDDPRGLERNYIRGDSDFIGFRATISTTRDQLAVAPGTLIKEWTEGERRFFRYEMNQPILNFFSVLSARYEVKEDHWNDVKLQVFYERKHPYNVDRMMQGMKDALAYCSAAFGPYQHQQARILEFPRYQLFAQSFPNTIPYSEGIGFIARVRDDSPDDLDYPYYVTAHEIAHQWWAHQVVGGNVQGATMTSETMAQYSALMVMKRRYGPEKMRRFLKYELDHYLVGRVTERKKELPLSRVENQMYIHYQKGSLAMYWLQDLVGEDVVNRALGKYVEAVKFKGPPYTNSTQLLSYLRAEIPEEHHGVLVDLFDTITIYDNRAVEASMAQNAAGGWDVKVKVKTVKYRSDAQGEQTEVTFDDVMEIGALDDDGNALFTEKRRLKQGETELTFTVPTRPARVGVDPLNKLVDRTSDDNTIAPTER